MSEKYLKEIAKELKEIRRELQRNNKTKSAGEITVFRDDNEFIASISLDNKDAIVKDGYKVSGYDKD